MTHSAHYCLGTLLPSPRPPTKYLINGRNCDTISNEPFIEPHFYNLEKLGTTDSELGAAASPDPPSWPNGASNTLTGAIKYPPPASFYNLIAADKPGTESSHVPAFSHPTPGMLSAALQGNLPPVSHQPPTPPRTPQGNKFDAEARGGGQRLELFLEMLGK